MTIYSEKSILSEQMLKYWWESVTDKNFLQVIEKVIEKIYYFSIYYYYYYIFIYYYYYYISIYYISITFYRIYYIDPIPDYGQGPMFFLQCFFCYNMSLYLSVYRHLQLGRYFKNTKMFVFKRTCLSLNLWLKLLPLYPH